MLKKLKDMLTPKKAHDDAVDALASVLELPTATQIAQRRQAQLAQAMSAQFQAYKQQIQEQYNQYANQGISNLMYGTATTLTTASMPTIYYQNFVGTTPTPDPDQDPPPPPPDQGPPQPPPKYRKPCPICEKPLLSQPTTDFWICPMHGYYIVDSKGNVKPPNIEDSDFCGHWIADQMTWIWQHQKWECPPCAKEVAKT